MLQGSKQFLLAEEACELRLSHNLCLFDNFEHKSIAAQAGRDAHDRCRALADILSHLQLGQGRRDLQCRRHAVTQEIREQSALSVDDL